MRKFEFICTFRVSISEFLQRTAYRTCYQTHKRVVYKKIIGLKFIISAIKTPVPALINCLLGFCIELINRTFSLY